MTKVVRPCLVNLMPGVPLGLVFEFGAKIGVGCCEFGGVKKYGWCLVKWFYFFFEAGVGVCLFGARVFGFTIGTGTGGIV